MPKTIDAHQHFWQLSQPFNYGWLDAPALAPIKRDYLWTELEPHLNATGTEGSIFVQTQHDVRENRWVLGMAERQPRILGVVGWVDLASPDCEQQLSSSKTIPSSSACGT